MALTPKQHIAANSALAMLNMAAAQATAAHTQLERVDLTEMASIIDMQALAGLHTRARDLEHAIAEAS